MTDYESDVLFLLMSRPSQQRSYSKCEYIWPGEPPHSARAGRQSTAQVVAGSTAAAGLASLECSPAGHRCCHCGRLDRSTACNTRPQHTAGEPARTGLATDSGCNCGLLHLNKRTMTQRTYTTLNKETSAVAEVADLPVAKWQFRHTLLHLLKE